MADVNKTMI